MNKEVLTYRLLSTAKLNRTPAKTIETPPRVCLFSVRLKPRFDAEISRQSSRVRKHEAVFYHATVYLLFSPRVFSTWLRARAGEEPDGEEAKQTEQSEPRGFRSVFRAKLKGA